MRPVLFAWNSLASCINAAVSWSALNLTGVSNWRIAQVYRSCLWKLTEPVLRFCTHHHFAWCGHCANHANSITGMEPLHIVWRRCFAQVPTRGKLYGNRAGRRHYRDHGIAVIGPWPSVNFSDLALQGSLCTERQGALLCGARCARAQYKQGGSECCVARKGERSGLDHG